MNRFLCLLLIVIFSFELHAQCPNGHIFFNTQEDIDSFAIKYPNCTQLIGTVEIISGNNNVSSLDGFDQIKKITGDLIILNNQNLIEIDGFNYLDTITKRLQIRTCENLTKVSGFKSLKSVNSIEFDTNSSLEEINLFEQLESIDLLRVSSPIPLQLNLNPSLSIKRLVLTGDISFDLHNTDFSDLNSVTIAESRLYTDFNHLQMVIPDTIKRLRVLRINNFDFKGLSSFNQLEYLGLTDMDSVAFSEKPIIDSPIRFSLHNVGGISDFNNLSGLKFKYINLEFLTDLASLEGMGDLNFLESINIRACSSLSSVSQLETALNLKDVNFFNNASLSQCNVSPICDLIEINSPDLTISWNLSSCENIDSVATQCIKTSSQELTVDNSLLFFPNPCTEFINLNADERSSISVLNIYNMNGARVKSIRDLTPRIDLGELPEGPYLFQAVYDDGIRSELIIIR